MAKNDSPATDTTPAAPDYILTVIHPFGAYKRGDRITEPAAIEQALSTNRRNVNKIKGGE